MTGYRFQCMKNIQTACIDDTKLRDYLKKIMVKGETRK